VPNLSMQDVTINGVRGSVAGSNSRGGHSTDSVAEQKLRSVILNKGS
jgi:hypothetical protein